MDRLPLEIYNQITSYLTCSEKRKLLLVCRHWYNMIKNGNLFNNFSIKGQRKFEAAAVFFEENASHRKQVRSLRLTKSEADPKYILSIPMRFPWIQDFAWAHYGASDYEDEDVNDKESVKHWENMISFEEINRNPLSKLILKSGGFRNLTQLTINLHFGDTDCRPIFKHLMNAPKLKQLDLVSPKMTLVDLEEIHCNTPQLETLYLTDIRQEGDELFEAQLDVGTVSVAKGLTSLRMRNMRMPGGGHGLSSSWMTYVAVKYKDLNHLAIDGVGMARGRQDYYETKLVDIAAGCPQLKSYRVNIFPTTPNILTAMDNNNTQLKRIDIIEDPAVEQINNLLKSHQSHSLETITMDYTHLDPNTLFNALKEFSTLKHLEIGNKFEKSIFLDAVFQKLENLETLKLSTFNISLESNHMNNFQTKLKCLILEKVIIKNINVDVMSFISRTCPDLSKLSIQGQIEDDNTAFKVEFPHHYFTSIVIDILSSEYYKVNNQRQITWYQFRGRNLQKSFHINNAPSFPFSEDQPHVSIVYEGSTSLKIGGTDIPNW